MGKADIDFSFIESLRRANQLVCHLTGCSVRFADSDERIKAHITTNHEDIIDNKKTIIPQLVADCRRANQNDGKGTDRGNQASSGQAMKDVLAKDSRLGETTSPTRGKSPGNQTATSRSRAAKAAHASPDPAFSRRHQLQTTHRGLYDPNNPSKKPTSVKQPETRPISQEQLVAEVKGIYAGLVMVEHAQRPQWTEALNDHLAKLARPNPLQQLFHHTKALYPPAPFTSARDSVRTRRKNRLRSYLPVLVDGKSTMALPDTQASHNIVTEDYAASVGAIIDRDPAKLRTFTNAVGGKIHSSGTVQMDIALLDDPTRLIKATFSVVEQCPESLVLGSSFLEEHKIFTKNGYSHNTVKVSPGLTHSKGNAILRVMHMGDLQKQLVCTVDHRYALAKADSGSDINLLSGDYASSMGFQITKIQTGENDHVMLADGSMEQLDGYVVADFSINGSQTPLKFYILKNLVCDVLLGDDTLESLDAFRKFPAAFVTQSHQDEPFHLIRWAERLKNVENDVEDILRSLDGGQDLPQKVGRWERLRSAFSNKADNSRRHDPKEIIRQLRDRLHEINIIESEYCAENAQRLMGLTGAELCQEQEADRRRRKVQDELRDRITKHIKDLSLPDHTAGAPAESRSTTTNSSSRT